MTTTDRQTIEQLLNEAADNLRRLTIARDALLGGPHAGALDEQINTAAAEVERCRDLLSEAQPPSDGEFRQLEPPVSGITRNARGDYRVRRAAGFARGNKSIRLATTWGAVVVYGRNPSTVELCIELRHDMASDYSLEDTARAMLNNITVHGRGNGR